MRPHEPWSEPGRATDEPSPPPLRLPAAPATPADLPWGVALLRLDDPATARAYLGPRDPQERARRSAVWNRPAAYRLRARLHLGMHDRMEEYMLADGRVHAGDAAGHARAFPLHLKSVRLPVLRLESGACADPTCTAADWPDLPATEERYLRVEIERLEVGPGACLAVAGNVACLWLGAIEGLDGLSADDPFVIRIRGTEHFSHSTARALGATDGAAGAPGRAGLPGRVTAQRGTPFGPRRDPALPDGAQHGGPGEPGGAGGAGTAGRNGGMVMVAGIEIDRFVGLGPGALRLDVEAAPGEPGGRGGPGGAGGPGGDGAVGWPHPDDPRTAGDGGEGGAGGPGGPGGAGGRGGLASHVFVTVPQGRRDRVRIDARPAPGGAGGLGGAGGYGGPGGAGGLGVAHPLRGADPDGAPGRRGPAGPDGPQGKRGRTGDPPPVWLFERPGGGRPGR